MLVEELHQEITRILEFIDNTKENKILFSLYQEFQSIQKILLGKLGIAEKSFKKSLSAFGFDENMIKVLTTEMFGESKNEKD